MLAKRVLTAVSAAVAAAMLSGCGVPTQVNGGGWLPSATGAGKANFGFWGDSCEGTIQGNFNYHDKNAGVKMNGTVTEAALCTEWTYDWEDASPACDKCNFVLGRADVSEVGYTAVLADYRSTNPRAPGEGTLVACVKDNGEGAKADAADELVVWAINGPFGGYANWQNLGGGNIQQEACPEDSD